MECSVHITYRQNEISVSLSVRSIEVTGILIINNKRSPPAHTDGIQMFNCCTTKKPKLRTCFPLGYFIKFARRNQHANNSHFTVLFNLRNHVQKYHK